MVNIVPVVQCHACEPSSRTSSRARVTRPFCLPRVPVDVLFGAVRPRVVPLSLPQSRLTSSGSSDLMINILVHHSDLVAY